MKEGWVYIALSSVCKVQNGFAFNSKLFNETNNGFPLVRIRDIKRGYSLTYTDEACSNDFYVEDGDMLIGMDGDFNIGEWKGGHALLNQRVCKLIPSEKILAKFIFYFIPEALQRINDKTAFATVKHLSSKQINAILLPNLPLSEQQSIVDYLDSAFAKIDAMKANAEKALNEAKALFQASLKEMLEPKEGWEEKKLLSLTSKIGSGATPKGGRKVYIEKGCHLIRSMNIQYNEFKYEDLAHITDDAADQLKSVEIQENDVLFNITGASIARCCVVPDDVLPARVNQHVSILRIKQGILPRFLSYLLNSPEHQKELLKIGEAGSTRQALTKTDLENHLIAYPNVDIQSKILCTLDSLKSKVDKLQENYDKISQECGALKQAILRQVFE